MDYIRNRPLEDAKEDKRGKSIDVKEGKQWEQADGDRKKSTRKGGDIVTEICEQEIQEKN